MCSRVGKHQRPKRNGRTARRSHHCKTQAAARSVSCLLSHNDHHDSTTALSPHTHTSPPRAALSILMSVQHSPSSSQCCTRCCSLHVACGLRPRVRSESGMRHRRKRRSDPYVSCLTLTSTAAVPVPVCLPTRARVVPRARLTSLMCACQTGSGLSSARASVPRCSWPPASP